MSKEFDPLTDALMAAAGEMVNDGWALGDGGEFIPSPDGLFITTIRRHVSPLLDMAALKRARIDALKAELAALESD